MNLLAFALHTARDFVETLWQKACQAIGARSRFFQGLRSISTYVVFLSWTSLMVTLVSGKASPV